MSKLLIQGPCCLAGELTVHGAKNSSLPLMAATLLCDSPSTLHNCPHLADVDTSACILRRLGCKVNWRGGSIEIDPRGVFGCDISDSLMREMRSSIIFLGSILSRMGKAVLSFPGGCDLGPRPIDLHLAALRKMGAHIREEGGSLVCAAPSGLCGANIVLSFPSVGATENIMLAACRAKGATLICNAAREPEIGDLADFLNACGAKISGAGESTISITGVPALSGCSHRVMPDRIAAATYMAAAAATGGNLLLRGICPAHLLPVLPVFEECGCRISIAEDTLSLTAPTRILRVKTVRTQPYPGFPTDAQAPVLAMLAAARGTSMFVENIFENRYKYIGELLRLGANIKVVGRVAVVEGVPHLRCAPVEAPDLRGGAALVVAALAAQGQTEVTGLHHIDRGYENLTENLRALGADIRRAD